MSFLVRWFAKCCTHAASTVDRQHEFVMKEEEGTEEDNNKKTKRTNVTPIEKEDLNYKLQVKSELLESKSEVEQNQPTARDKDLPLSSIKEESLSSSVREIQDEEPKVKRPPRASLSSNNVGLRRPADVKKVARILRESLV